MRGEVLNLQALLPVTFQLPDQPHFTVQFVIDSGFTGFLTLPPNAIKALNLPFLYRIPADLADASTIELDVYEATILWQDIQQHVPLLAIGQRPLLGTALLAGNEVHVQFIENGQVSIESI